MYLNPLEHTVNSLLKITHEEQKHRLRNFARSPLESQVEIMRLKQESFHSLYQNNKEITKATLSYVAFIFAIGKYNNTTNILDRNVLNMRSKSLRSQPKRERLIGYWALIKLLKIEKKLSFRNITRYLLKYHKFNIAHSTIYDLWMELESNNKEGKNNG